MGFDAQAFATTFLKQLGQGVETRLAEAKVYEKEEKEKAKANIKVYNQRKAKMKTAQMYAQAIRKALGPDNPEANKAIMYYAKDGVASLQAAYKAILSEQQKARETLNYDFGSEQVAELLNIPESFKTDPDMSMENFWEQTFNLANENETVEPSESSEGRMGNIFKGALGIGAKDAVERKLAVEKFRGDKTVADINAIAESEEYRDVFGGIYEPSSLNLQSLPTLLDATDVRAINGLFTKKKNTYTKEAYITDYLASIGITDDGKKGTIRGAITSIRQDPSTGLGYKDFEAWATKKAKDEVITEQFGDKAIPESVANQLPFLSVGDTETVTDGTTGETDKTTEMPDLTKTKLVTSDILENKIAKKDDGFVYIVTESSVMKRSKDYDGVLGKKGTVIGEFNRAVIGTEPVGVLYRIPASKAHLYNLAKDNPNEKILVMSTNKEEAFNQLSKLKSGLPGLGGSKYSGTPSFIQNILNVGIGIKDLEIPTQETDTSPVASVGDKNFAGVTVKSFLDSDGTKKFTLQPVYQAKDGEGYSVPSAPVTSLRRLAVAYRNRGKTVGSEEAYQTLLKQFNDVFLYTPSEEEIQEYIK
tara:strand:+ start:939 stop:2705 length:1767 start_codon:yes stop_codon:yes gene_type:complete